MEMKSFPTEYFAQTTPVRRHNPSTKDGRFEQQPTIPPPTEYVSQRTRSSTRALGSGRERVKNEMANSFTRNEEISILPGFKQKSRERLSVVLPPPSRNSSALEDVPAKSSKTFTNTCPGLCSKDRNSGHHFENLPADNDKEKIDRAMAQSLYKQELDRQIQERNNLREKEIVKVPPKNEKPSRSRQQTTRPISSENTGYLPSWFEPPEKFRGPDDYSAAQPEESPQQQYPIRPNTHGIPNFFPIPHETPSTNQGFLPTTPVTPGGNLGFLAERPIAPSPSISQSDLMYLQQKLEMTYLQQQNEMAILEKQKEMAFLQRRNEEAYLQTVQRQTQLAHLMKLQGETAQSINSMNSLPQFPLNNQILQPPSQYAQTMSSSAYQENSASRNQNQGPSPSSQSMQPRQSSFSKPSSPSPQQQAQAEYESTDRNPMKNMLKLHVSQTAEQRPDDNLLKEVYSKQLLMQIEERKRKEEERIAAEKAEEERFQRRLAEDQAKMKREYEEELERLRQKAEEREEKQKLALRISEEAKKAAEKLKQHKRRTRNQLTIAEDSQEIRDVSPNDTTMSVIEPKALEMGMGDQIPIINVMGHADLIPDEVQEEYISTNEQFLPFPGDQQQQHEIIPTSAGNISIPSTPKMKPIIVKPIQSSPLEGFKILRNIRRILANETNRMEKVIQESTRLEESELKAAEAEWKEAEAKLKEVAEVKLKAEAKPKVAEANSTVTEAKSKPVEAKTVASETTESESSEESEEEESESEESEESDSDESE